MTLGEMYQKYNLFLYRYKGRGVTKHKAHEECITFELWLESNYQIPWNTEVEVRNNEFFINGFQARFCARLLELTPEILIQADMAGGYIPVDISNHTGTIK